MKSPKINFLYNLVYQVLILIIPLITAPYLTRVVGADGIGTYTYTYSIVYYFMLLTLLGVNNYGNRSIAKVRDHKKELSKTFWSIYCFQLICGVIMMIAYLGYVEIIGNEYKQIAIIQSLFILSSILDINWFYFGTEEFKLTISRNLIVKLLNIILIFCLVKSQNDLWKYTMIMSGMTILSQLLLWPFLKGRIEFTKIKFSDIKQHIKPNLVLFMPVIAVSLYKMMDKVMLGILSDVREVAYYEYAEKITNIPLTLITALGTVMLPRISNLLAKGNDKEINKYIKKSINFVMFMSFAMTFGLLAIGYRFAPIYFGNEFQKSGLLIMLLAVTLPVISFANVIRTQYLIPFEKDKIFTISVSLGALTNWVMNLIFIPGLTSIGACIGTVAAEIVVMSYQTLNVKGRLNVNEYIRDSFKFFFKALLMFLTISTFNWLDLKSIYIVILQVIFGIVIYVLLNIKYIQSIIDLNRIKEIFLKRS